MKRICFIVLCVSMIIGFGSFSFACEDLYQQLETEVHMIEDQAKKVEALSELVNVYKHLADAEFIMVAISLENIKEILPTKNTYMTLGGMYVISAQQKKAKQCFLKALEMCSDCDSSQKFVVYYSLANIYKNEAKYNMSIDFLRKAINCTEDMMKKNYCPGGVDLPLSQLLLELGFGYYSVGEIDKAIETLNSSLDLCVKDYFNDDRVDYYLLYSTLSFSTVDTDNHQALAYAKLAKRHAMSTERIDTINELIIYIQNEIKESEGGAPSLGERSA